MHTLLQISKTVCVPNTAYDLQWIVLISCAPGGRIKATDIISFGRVLNVSKLSLTVAARCQIYPHRNAKLGDEIDTQYRCN